MPWPRAAVPLAVGALVGAGTVVFWEFDWERRICVAAVGAVIALPGIIVAAPIVRWHRTPAHDCCRVCGYNPTGNVPGRRPERGETV